MDLSGNDGVINLHCHTTASDGKLSPRELVRLACEEGLEVIAITDHDSIDGIEEGLKEGELRGVRVIAGVEITCDGPGYVDIHILGLGIDPKSEGLGSLLEKAKKQREAQKRAVIKRLNELGLKVSFEEVKDISGGEIGRPHIAKIVLKNNPEKVSSMQDVFDKYLASDKPGFVQREEGISIGEAVRAIQSAGGLAFVAHPAVYERIEADALVEHAEKEGVDGIETFYAYGESRLDSSNSEEKDVIARMRKMAEKRGMLQTGGSDFHGREGQRLTKMSLPREYFDQIELRLRAKDQR